jgi:hypothetical protein
VSNVCERCDEIKEDEVNGTWSTHGGNAYKILARKKL